MWPSPFLVSRLFGICKIRISRAWLRLVKSIQCKSRFEVFAHLSRAHRGTFDWSSFWGVDKWWVNSGLNWGLNFELQTKCQIWLIFGKRWKVLLTRVCLNARASSIYPHSSSLSSTKLGESHQLLVKHLSVQIGHSKKTTMTTVNVGWRGVKWWQESPRVFLRFAAAVSVQHLCGQHGFGSDLNLKHSKFPI